MDDKLIIDRLDSLAEVDIDAANAYTQAIKVIDIKLVIGTLEEYRSDHERHYDSLSRAIKNLRGKPPDISPDFKGFLISGFTRIRGKTGMMGALEAMESNEKLTIKKYKEAAEMDFPRDILNIVVDNYRDEIKHFDFFRTQLRILRNNPQFYELAQPDEKLTR